VLAETSVQIAPSTYYAAKTRPPSARAVRDERVKAEIARVHAENFGVYGVRKVYRQLRRDGGVDGQPVPECQVRRVMRGLGLAGAVRGRTRRTTVPGEVAARTGDLVERNFTAPAPNRLWVADLTYGGWGFGA
jgi:putative transposase